MPSHWLLLFCVVHRLSPDAPANLFCAINKISSSRFSQCSKSQFIEEPFRWIWNFRRLCEFRCTFCQRSIGKIYSSVRGTIMINWTLDGDRVLNRNRLCADRICYFEIFLYMSLTFYYMSDTTISCCSSMCPGIGMGYLTLPRQHMCCPSPLHLHHWGARLQHPVCSQAPNCGLESLQVGRLLCREGIPFCWKLKMHGVKL